MLSTIRVGETITFPPFADERHYMVPFDIATGLPSHLAHWQETVDTMLSGVGGRVAYLMIDQARVLPGCLHRRGGPHVDGNWIEGIRTHGGSGNGPGHVHPGTTTPSPPKPDPGPHHSHRGHAHLSYRPEAIILASDIEGCRAYVGSFHGEPKDDGDCSHLDFSNAVAIAMRAGVAYVGNVTMVHESLQIAAGGRRTLVRLNVPQ